MWLRLRQIALVAHKLAPIAQDMHDVFGLEVGFRDPGVKAFGLENALFPVGNQFIEVVSPIQENTAGGRYLDRRRGEPIGGRALQRGGVGIHHVARAVG